MFNLFRRRRKSAQADGGAPSRQVSAAPADESDSWQKWEGAGPPMQPTAGSSVGGTAGGPSQPPGESPEPAAGRPPPNRPEPPEPPEPPNAPAPRGLALDEIARGMQHAAAAANQLLAQQYTRVLDTFFDSDDAGLLTARSVEVELDAEHTMPVPLVALATPRGLALEKMVVHLTVRGDFAEAMAVDGGDQRARFHVTLAPPSKRSGDAPPRERDTEHIDIEMHFAALNPPDAIMRVIDEYTHRLVPHPKRGSRTDEEKTHA